MRWRAPNGQTRSRVRDDCSEAVDADLPSLYLLTSVDAHVPIPSAGSVEAILTKVVTSSVLCPKQPLRPPLCAQPCRAVRAA